MPIYELDDSGKRKIRDENAIIDISSDVLANLLSLSANIITIGAAGLDFINTLCEFTQNVLKTGKLKFHF